MSTLRQAIKQAITDHHPTLKGNRVWKIEKTENLAGEITLWIEVSATPKTKKKKK